MHWLERDVASTKIHLQRGLRELEFTLRHGAQDKVFLRGLPYRAPTLDILTRLISSHHVPAEDEALTFWRRWEKLHVLTTPHTPDSCAVIQSVKDLPDLQTLTFLPRKLSSDASAASVPHPPIFLPDEEGEPAFLALKHFSISASLRDVASYFLLAYQPQYLHSCSVSAPRIGRSPPPSELGELIEPLMGASPHLRALSLNTFDYSDPSLALSANPSRSSGSGSGSGSIHLSLPSTILEPLKTSLPHEARSPASLPVPDARPS